MAVLLGIDFGGKRIGVAVSDETETIATPLATLQFRSRKQVLEDLIKIFDRDRAAGIVVGLPLDGEGKVGPAARKIMDHVEWMQAHLNCEWIYWDERFTTCEAESVLLEADMPRGRRKKVRDKIAAQRILQHYLDNRLRKNKL